MPGISPITISPMFGRRGNGINDPFIVASGGTVTNVGDYRYHVLAPGDTFVVNYVPSTYNNTIHLDVIGAGGGGGAGNGGSGGGAGGLITQSSFPIVAGAFTINVGLKGLGSITGNNDAGFGGASTFMNFAARGGGWGLDGGSARVGGDGGSGGGGVRNAYGPGLGISGQGFNGGGSSNSPIFGTGGGGGSFEAGQDGSTLINGKGGDGTNIDLIGVTTKVAAGGGGGVTGGAGISGNGGNGGGGNGSTTTGGNATQYGSGGGGAGPGFNGGNGFNGVIVIKYPYQNILNPIVPITYDYKQYLQVYTYAHVRYDQPCVIKLQNGKYLMGVDKFGPTPGDGSGAEIAFYSSDNGITGWTYLSSITTLNISNVVPNLRQKANGDIVCVYLDVVTSTTTRILQRVSSNAGLSWSSLIIVRENPSEYLTFASREIYKTQTGRWVLCFEKNTSMPLDTGNYEGYTAYSDNEGTTWTIPSTTIISPTNQFTESGIIEKPNGTLMRYARCGSPIYACDSTDDCVTWGTPYYINVNTTDSQSSILRVTDGSYKLAYNPSSGSGRRLMKIATSNDLLTWTDFYTLEDDPTNHTIEPYLIQIATKLSVYYSFSDVSHNYYDLKQALVPI